MKSKTWEIAILCMVIMLLCFMGLENLTTQKGLLNEIEKKNAMILDIQDTVRQYEQEIIVLHDKLDSHKKLWNCTRID